MAVRDWQGVAWSVGVAAGMIATNHVGPVLLTAELTDLMKQIDAAIGSL